MICPKCGKGKLKTIDTREVTKGKCVKRRKQCTKCEERFTTHEVFEVNFEGYKKNFKNYYIVIYDNLTHQFKSQIINLHPLQFNVLDHEVITYWTILDNKPKLETN